MVKVVKSQKTKKNENRGGEFKKLAKIEKDLQYASLA